MQTLEYRTIDKSVWPRGPWDDEPDKKQWQDPETGLACLVKRNLNSGALCGYVGVPEGHKFFGYGYDDVDIKEEPHGGLTYAGLCQEGPPEITICHVGDDHEPLWWVGFDCAHFDDHLPGLVNVLDAYRIAVEEGGLGLVQRARASAEGTYRDLAYVEAECRALAKELVK